MADETTHHQGTYECKGYGCEFTDDDLAKSGFRERRCALGSRCNKRDFVRPKPATAADAAVDAVLDELRAQRDSGREHDPMAARNVGIAAGRAFLEDVVDRVCFAVMNNHDGQELWAHARRDPESFRYVVRIALGLLGLQSNDASASLVNDVE